MAFVLFLEYMSQFELSASQVREKFQTYISLEETNFRVHNVKEVLSFFEKKYETFYQETFDGLTIRTDDYWFNLRASSNEPLIRLNLEAKNSAIFESTKTELLSNLQNFIAS